MKRIFSLILCGVMLLSLVACSGNSTQSNSTNSSGTRSENTTDNNVSGSNNEAGTGNADSSSDQTGTSTGSNILVAYFSLAGEQYSVGVIAEGNTGIIAHMIAEKTGADLFEIKAVTPYPTTYNGLLDVSRKEMSDNARPAIVGTVDNMGDYDVVFIGYPNWWGDMPMIVYNFLESYDFSGKTVIPFCTHGGSGLSRTESTIKDITGASMPDGFDIAGATAQNDRDKAEQSVTKWLEKIGYGG